MPGRFRLKRAFLRRTRRVRDHRGLHDPYVTTLPTTITAPGTWCLSKDLATAITSGSAISITTNNVTLDCNDFRLGGLAAGAGTRTMGISALDRVNVTVRNCAVRGFWKGIVLNGSTAGGDIASGHLIEHNRLDGNTWLGIDVGGEGSLVRDNRITNTGGATGITNNVKAAGIYTSGEVDVVDNYINGVVALAGSNGYAIGINPGSNAVSSITGNRVRNVVADGEGWAYGVGFWGEVGRVTIEDNHLMGSSATNSLAVWCPAVNQAMATRNVAAGWVYANFFQCAVDSGNLTAP